MQPESDAQLLAGYAERGDERAFTEIVARHANLVYSAALRQVNSSDIAAEVAQQVFIGLARGAQDLSRRLATDASLAGWLCRSARNVSLNLRRDEFRRHSRERQAMEHPAPTPETAPDWEHLRPVLDEAMSELSEPDYDALVMRFFKNQDLRSVGLALGLSDDAAQKRVARALDKLREQMSRRGIGTTTAALSIAISANAVQVAPAGLAATLSATALAGTTLATTATATATKAIAMTTLQKTLIAATLAVAVGAGVYEARQNSKLREQNQTFRQQQAPLTAQIEQITRERDDTTRQLAALREDNARLNSNTAELLRLRGEVAMLRQNPTHARSAEEETAQLRLALAESQSKVERLEFEKLDRNIVSDMIQLVNAMRTRPRNYNGFMATNFDQLISEIDLKTNANGSLVFSQSGNELAMFEFMNVGQVNDTLPQKLIFRERTARKTPDGNWTRAYGRADGSVQKRVSSTGDFEPWEKMTDRVEPPSEP